MKTYELVLHKINNGLSLSRLEIFEGMKSLIESSDHEHVRLQMGMILFGLSVRNPSVDEILGLCDFVKEVEPMLLQRKLVAQVDGPVIGLSGSGKKGIKTFNISTPAALIAVTAGAYIAKPVSKATSSTTGSSDLLAIAGASLDLSHQNMLKALEKTGFGAFSIEHTIPAFDHIYGGKFYAPHALSYVLSAIVNPVKCKVMMHGLAGEHVDISAKTLKALGIKKGAVMSSTEYGSLYIDELSPISKNSIAFWDENSEVSKAQIDVAEAFGCGNFKPEELAPGINNQYQLKIFLDCLRGTGTPAQLDAVALNSALIIMNSGIELDPRKAFQLSKDIIHSGKAEQTLDHFCEVTKLLAEPSLSSRWNPPEATP